MSSSTLRFEDFRAQARLRRGLAPSRATAADCLLAETEHFFAIAALGSLTPGDVLLLPKSESITSFATLPAPLQEEADWFRQQLHTALGQRYQAPVAEFEHAGAASSLSGTPRASLHLCPLAPSTTRQSLSEAVDAIFRERAVGITKVTTRRGREATNACDIATMLNVPGMVPPENIEGALLRTETIAHAPHESTTSKAQHMLASAGRYVAFSAPSLGLSWLSDTPMELENVSQPCRAMVARALANNDPTQSALWDWRLHPNHETMTATMQDLAPSLAALSVSGAGDAFGFKTHVAPMQLARHLPPHAGNEKGRG